MCLGYSRNNAGHRNSVSSGPVSCVFQAEQLLVPLLVLAKDGCKNWKLKKYKIINSCSKLSNFNFILKTNFFTSKFVLIFTNIQA